ncbi:dipeptide transporter; membrane component of ABC superfamily [Mesorhizobium plurifarium]|uniref:Dipeptide transporter membrane component of ABC superfamily n=1 Tax=Mesorhizobium plurifarium TaxID=69974 RepID=A0A090DKG8_MESPL|nr:dipeptide transporter; membrane component of ABC superfamily [Mesorhizobium plurifarium]
MVRWTPVSEQALIERQPRERIGKAGRVLRRILREPLGAFGLTLVVIVVLSALFADVLTSYPPTKLAPAERFAPASLQHLLGTDHLGRDLFSRVLHGGRIALAIALGATGLSLIGGIVLGLIAGYGPRWLDNLMLLLFDAIKSFPTVMLALTLVTLTGPSLLAVLIVVVLVNVPGYARIIRTQTLVLKSAEHVMAARSMGASTARILTVHILPNVIGPILILASMDIPVVVAIEAGLSFLGLGVRPPLPSWGAILNDGFVNIRDSYWIVVAGGLPIILTTLGFTFLGETLRDIFDPRLKRRE